MNLNLRWRVLIALGAVALAAFLLYPTYGYLSLTPAEIADMDPKIVERMKGDALRLGLDLQGGMHVVLELDDSEAEDLSAADVMDRALEVIRNRIDEFGVTEPVVQQAGSRRIIVELAGVDDFERAENIISRAARLEFKMVRSGPDMRRLVDKLDLELASTVGFTPAASTDTTSESTLLEGAAVDPHAALTEGADTAASADEPEVREESAEPQSAPEDAAAHDAETVTRVASPGSLPQYLVEDVKATNGQPLASRILYFTRQGKVGLNEESAVRETDFEIVSAYLAFLEDPLQAIPADVEFRWHSDTSVDGQGNRLRYLYLLRSRPELTGEELESARPQPDNSSNVAGNFQVDFSLSRKGRRLFSRATGENVGRLMAIVLDDKVKSAPEIQDKIRGGTASITGRFTAAEAKDLAVVLQAGALPLPILIEEQRAVGPSLGQDSITLGSQAIVFGFLGVLVFMVAYYRAAGGIAVFALLLNLVFLAAALVSLDAVLTLPGIAGFVLTVGMAVDANVLIFERIREELRLGQTFRNAVNRGYDKAFRTILDANVTTLVTALALLWFGTGPIKGFAVVLSIGIIVSMFTALFVTRVIFDLFTRGGGARRVAV